MFSFRDNSAVVQQDLFETLLPLSLCRLILTLFTVCFVVQEIRNMHNEQLMGIRREEEMEMSDDDMEDTHAPDSKDSEDSGMWMFTHAIFKGYYILGIFCYFVLIRVNTLDHCLTLPHLIKIFGSYFITVCLKKIC